MIASIPVSSLVHSSTLIIAGIYLLIHVDLYVDLSQCKYKNIILLISRLIIFIRLRTNFKLNLKKIVAYSILRQLIKTIFIIRILSIEFTELVFLFIHAIFNIFINIYMYWKIHTFYK